MQKEKAPRNRTLTILKNEYNTLKNKLLFPQKEKLLTKQIVNKTICGDLFVLLDLLPNEFADLIIIDPPYNLSKNFNGFKFSKTNDDAYLEYLKS